MFLYIYKPSDFVETVPSEAGSGSVSGGPWTLTLKPGATPISVEITDNDNIFDELDTTQNITNAVTLDGNTWAAGETIHSAYDLINSTTGHKVTTLHFGGNGNQVGAVDGLVSTVRLVEGESYTFNQSRTSNKETNEYEQYVACFTADTLIETVDGLIPVQDLQVGCMIQTLDHGPQPLMALLSRHVDVATLQEMPNLAPVRITAGALGQGLPLRDLLVSPQHRFLARSVVVRRMFEAAETLLSAKQLTALPGIAVDNSQSEVTYFHLVMPHHEIVIAEGTPTESFYCGEMAMKSLTPAARAELSKLFPDLLTGVSGVEPVRPLPSPRRQKQLVSRLLRNTKPVLAA
ncbi:hypothetical protein GGR95_001448 [Sulfitobacter undariae]|uniref:Hedgehog/Intein (Hint) domain-containing protein n=1 Tax=Sulfitobacter undariae TaxID=1563671 RepID=A0A7W6E2Y9_9RHOB|nr:hypothetical protein [Sulfitobacter undariae]